MKILLCGCKPGSLESGWQEVRSAVCQAKDLEAFRRVMEKILRPVRSN